jgi:hypothetical protein
MNFISAAVLQDLTVAFIEHFFIPYTNADKAGVYKFLFQRVFELLKSEPVLNNACNF